MRLKELLLQVNYEHVWSILECEYSLTEDAYDVYRRVMEELKSLEAKPGEKQTTLVVAKIQSIFEPGNYIFDVFGLHENDDQRYCLTMTPWEEWNNLTVLDKSIELYGAVAVAAHALFEMTFYGFSAEETAKRVAEEMQILNDRYDEIESGRAQLIPHEEVMAELGFEDNRTPEEKALEDQQIKNIHAENEEIFKTLLNNR